MTLANKIYLLLVAVLCCVGLDQATKRLAVFALKDREPLVYLAGAFRLEYAENSGAFLGMGAELPDWQRYGLLTIISGGILVGLLVFLVAKKNLTAPEVLGYGLILAGGISNMIDRVLVGVVIDFLNVGLGSLRTGIFNIADMAIMGGLLLVVRNHLRALIPGFGRKKALL